METDEFFSYQAEQAVIGSILVDAMLYPSIKEIISRDNFHKMDHQNIFEAIEYCFKNNVEPDLLTVWQRLDDKKIDISRSYLATLTECAPIASNAAYYAGIVKEKFLRRELFKLGHLLIQECNDPDKQNPEIISSIFYELFNLDMEHENKSTAKQAGEKLLEVIRERQGKELIGLSSGFDEIDQVTKGYVPYAFIVFAADLGTGKTTFCLNKAVRRALKGSRILYISLEVPDIELMESIVPGLANMDLDFTYDDMTDTELSEEKLASLEGLVNEASELPLFFRWGIYQINEILTTIEHYRRRHKIDAVYIDHIQLLDAAEDYNEYVKQTKLLKQYCMKKKIPIIALSQLNSYSKARGDKEPSEYDLRGGKNLGQDADIIYYLYKFNRDDKETYLKIHNKRRGKTNRFNYYDVLYDPDHRAVALQDRDSRPVPKDSYESKSRKKKNKKEPDQEDPDQTVYNY